MEYICSTLPPTSLSTASCPSKWLPQIPSMKVLLKVMRCDSLFLPLSSVFPKQLPCITLANALNLCSPILCSTSLANPNTEWISSPTFYSLHLLAQIKIQSPFCGQEDLGVWAPATSASSSSVTCSLCSCHTGLFSFVTSQVWYSYLDALDSGIFVANSLTSFSSLLKCHLIGNILSNNLCEIELLSLLFCHCFTFLHSIHHLTCYVLISFVNYYLYFLSRM